MSGKWDNELLEDICKVTKNSPDYIKTIIKQLLTTKCGYPEEKEHERAMD